MRVRRKLSRSQLKQVKQSLKEYKTNEALDDIEREINEMHEVSSSIADVRVELANLAREDGYDLKAIRRLEKRERKKARHAAALEHPVLVSWNLNVGDAVECDMGGEKHIGIIIDQDSDGEFFNFSQAKYRSGIMVMTPVGKRYLRANQLVKI
jgi:hypothetical protein